MSKPPAFQLYAADFYMDTLSWDAETVGVYFRLLMHEWVNGYVPNDIDKIARISGMMVDRKWRANMQRIWRELCTKFVTLPDGNLVNVRMEETRNEQESYKEKLSLSGRLGGLRSQEIRKNKTSNPLTDPSSKASSENERLLTSTSLSINNNTIEKKPKKKFVIPTIEEITQYCSENSNLSAVY